jgi:hypothetical protein
MVCPCCNLDDCPEKGACCVNGECIDYLSESECDDLGGTWQGCCERCHPTYNAQTDIRSFPCGDTSTPTCCDAFAAKYTQVVITLQGLVKGTGASTDCSCMNSTYVFDIDLQPLSGTTLVQDLVAETLNNALSGCPFTTNDDVICEIQCNSQYANDTLTLLWQTRSNHVTWKYEAGGIFLTLGVITTQSESGDACETTCDDLADNITATVSFTFSSNSECDRSNASASITFQ